jgi:hypothetical protein
VEKTAIATRARFAHWIAALAFAGAVAALLRTQATPAYVHVILVSSSAAFTASAGFALFAAMRKGATGAYRTALFLLAAGGLLAFLPYTCPS